LKGMLVQMDLKKTNTQMESVGENDDDNERIHDS